MVDIAAYGTHHRAYGLQPQQQVNVADVPGVPNLIAVLEMDGVTVIPRAMRVRQNAYTFHP